jgi:microcystin-dependent protein
MDNVPTQTAGTSAILASDWNTYVRDNFDSIKSGHIVCTSTTRPTGVVEGTMIYETDTNLIYLYSGSQWNQNNLTPVGMISPFAGSSAPGGWLLCDAAAVSRTTYASLFALIGTTYGVGDGSTTFNVPDLRGRTALGLGTNANADVLGESDGISTVANRNPKHSHTVNSHTHASGSLYALWTCGGGVFYTNQIGTPGWTSNQDGGIGTNNRNLGPIGTGTAMGGSTDGSSPGTNEQSVPYLTVNYIIKV